MADAKEIPVDVTALSRLRFFRDLNPSERMKVWRALAGAPLGGETVSHVTERILFDRYIGADKAARSAQPMAEPLDPKALEAACSTCRFYAVGSCRQSPPVRLPRRFDEHATSGNRVRDEKVEWGWPMVQPTDWCGHFQRGSL